MQKNSSDVITERRGFPVYATNPSVPAPGEISTSRRAQIGTEQKGLVVNNGNGEILGAGTALMYQWEEVDKERFVKLYLAGLKQAVGLSKAGLAMFELIYKQMQDNPGKDSVQLSVHTSPLPARTYQRGVRELLEREFLFSSPFEGIFFVNIRFMFNGDRIAFVKGYRLKKDTRQLDLLDGPREANTIEPDA